MHKMNTGEFKMAPLSDFTVTFTDRQKKPTVNISWRDWCAANGEPDFTMNGHKLIFDMKKPEGLNIVMPDNDPPYELVWAE